MSIMTIRNMKNTRIIHVETSSPYEVYIGNGLLDLAGEMIKNPHAACEMSPEAGGLDEAPWDSSAAGESSRFTDIVEPALRAPDASNESSRSIDIEEPVSQEPGTADEVSRDLGNVGVAGAMGFMHWNPGVPKKIVVVSDDHVYPLYGAALEERFRQQGVKVSRFVFPHGESSKCMAVYEQLLEMLSKESLTRTDMLAALGGGVTGDLTGFAAATYQRGIRYVQIPTTLLAAVDSSVGGKTAINLKNGKNQVGCFYQPSMVLCDPDTLQTLPQIEYQNGMSEVIKYGMIKDAAFLQRLREQPAEEWISEVICRCVSMKRDVVNMDEFDTGERMLLNFGHTIGHGVESCSHYQIPHSIAVAMGMASITRAAERMGVCPAGTAEELEHVLDAYHLPKEIPYSPKELYAAAMADKKKAGDTLRIVVPETLGHCIIKTIPANEFQDWIG